jgi:hypothetical protein
MKQETLEHKRAELLMELDLLWNATGESIGRRHEILKNVAILDKSTLSGGNKLLNTIITGIKQQLGKR